MNIISNNCVSARIYELMGMQFNNPFMFTLILPNDFIYLIKNWEQIDFQNAAIQLSKRPREFSALNLDTSQNVYSILVDNKISVYFIHHYFRKQADTVQRIDNNLFFNRMDQYIQQKYSQRLQRMVDDPLFLVIANKTWSNENIQEFCNIDTKFRKICVINNTNTVKYPNNTTIVKYDGFWNITNISRYLINNNILDSDIQQDLLK